MLAVNWHLEVSPKPNKNKELNKNNWIFKVFGKIYIHFLFFSPCISCLLWAEYPAPGRLQPQSKHSLAAHQTWDKNMQEQYQNMDMQQQNSLFYNPAVSISPNWSMLIVKQYKALTDLLEHLIFTRTRAMHNQKKGEREQAPIDERESLYQKFWL